MEDRLDSAPKNENSAASAALRGAAGGFYIGTFLDDFKGNPNNAARGQKIFALNRWRYSAVGVIVFGVEHLMTRHRKKRDFVNGAVGGFVAGVTVFGYKSVYEKIKGTGIPKAVSAGATFAAVAAVGHIMLVEQT